MIDKVAATHFYQDDGDKIKLNWSMYEYANMLYSEIEEAPKLTAYRKKHSRDDIVAFCVYFSKRMRKSVIHALDKTASGIGIEISYVYEFYPKISKAQALRLLDTAVEIWVEHATNCARCPNQCLTNGFELTDMFDNLDKTGWPTR